MKSQCIGFPPSISETGLPLVGCDGLVNLAPIAPNITKTQTHVAVYAQRHF